MPKPVVFVVLAVMTVAAVGAVFLRSATKPTGEPAAAASAESETGLGQAMTFTEPKK